MKYALVAAPFPALLLSLYMMQTAQAGRALIIQQIAVAVVSATICAIAIGRSRKHLRLDTMLWMLVCIAICLWIPVLMQSGDGPKRWVSLGGLRLYLAAVLLPTALLMLARVLREPNVGSKRALLTIMGIGTALAAQPDASQVTAFVAGCAVLATHTKMRMADKLVAAGALVLLICAAWVQPDPLKPVAYVEGVLELAQGIGPLALLAALGCLLLPPIMLVQHSRRANRGEFLAVAMYYVALDCAAYFQLTPMPLLGFGAGPILGYFVMLVFAHHCRHPEVA